jgi:hypothetical protein
LRTRPKQIPSLEENGTLLNFSVEWQKTQEGSGERALARAGFTEDAEDLLAAEVKVNA